MGINKGGGVRGERESVLHFRCSLSLQTRALRPFRCKFLKLERMGLEQEELGEEEAAS